MKEATVMDQNGFERPIPIGKHADTR